MMWLPAHRRDVESDLSAFHQVTDIDELPAARFYALAWRTPHYRGVMRERVLAYQYAQEQAGGGDLAATPPGSRAQPRRAAARAVAPVTKADAGDPVMSKLFDFETVKLTRPEG